MEQGSLTIEKLLYYQQKSYLNHPIKWDYSWTPDALEVARTTESEKASAVLGHPSSALHHFGTGIAQ